MAGGRASRFSALNSLSIQHGIPEVAARGDAGTYEIPITTGSCLSRKPMRRSAMYVAAMKTDVGLGVSRRLWTERSMIFDYALAGLVTAGLLIYLTYALLRPERF